MSNPADRALPPGPRGALIQTLRYFRDPYGYFEKMAVRYGKLFTMPTMNGSIGSSSLEFAGMSDIGRYVK